MIDIIIMINIYIYGCSLSYVDKRPIIPILGMPKAHDGMINPASASFLLNLALNFEIFVGQTRDSSTSIHSGSIVLETTVLAEVRVLHENLNLNSDYNIIK